MYPFDGHFLIRETLDKYSLELQRLTISLLKMVARNLRQETEKLTRMFEDGVQGVRMNYYPPCVQANKVIGLTPHSDSTGLTLLIQVNDVQGLQIKKNGKWISIEPIPGAFIVNIGDVIEVISYNCDWMFHRSPLTTKLLGYSYINNISSSQQALTLMYYQCRS